MKNSDFADVRQPKIAI